jgi:hypothetical protein
MTGSDRWVPVSARVRGKGGYRFGKGFLGRGLDLELGQIVSPGAFSIFISPLLLFFSVFLILSKLLHLLFKLIQINL